MRLKKSLILVLIYLFLAQAAFAQRTNQSKSRATRNQYNYKAPVVRGAKAKVVCQVFETSSYPYHGLGVKVGDPFAFTYKFYPNKRFSFVVDAGRPASGLYNRYYREQFGVYAATDTFSNDGASLRYLAHRVNTDLIAEGKFLYHVDGKEVSPGMQIYFGGGWQWRNTQLEYVYRYFDGNPLVPESIGQVKQNRFTMGPQLVLGIEYAYFKQPLSAFMELEYFTDIQADPGWQRFEGGIGLRYIF